MPPTAQYLEVSQPEGFNKPPLRWLLALFGAQVRAEGSEGNWTAGADFFILAAIMMG